MSTSCCMIFSRGWEALEHETMRDERTRALVHEEYEIRYRNRKRSYRRPTIYERKMTSLLSSSSQFSSISPPWIHNTHILSEAYVYVYTNASRFPSSRTTCNENIFPRCLDPLSTAGWSVPRTAFVFILLSFLFAFLRVLFRWTRIFSVSIRKKKKKTSVLPRYIFKQFT